MWITNLVVGMHRSGTSATAAALAHLSLNVGSASRLMGASLANPFGFFETLDISQFNDAVLHKQGRTWDSVSLSTLDPFDESDISTARGLVFGDDELITCVKDPRISVLLPLWRSALLDRITSVVVIRDPREVVWSLVLRDGLTPVLAAALWIVYNAHIAHESSGLPHAIVDYDDLVTRSHDTISSLATFLTENGAIEGCDAEHMSLATKSIKPLARRATFPDRLSDHPLVSEAVKIFDSVKNTGSLSLIPDRLAEKNARLEHLCNEVIQMHRASANVLARVTARRSQTVPPERQLIGSTKETTEIRATLEHGVSVVRDDQQLSRDPLAVDIDELRSDLHISKKRVADLEASRSFRIGRVITWPVRLVKRLFFNDHNEAI
jgi:hypothetical protein